MLRGSESISVQASAKQQTEKYWKHRKSQLISILETLLVRVPGGTWVFFGCVCVARDSKLAPRSKKNFSWNWYPVLEMGQFFIPRYRINSLCTSHKSGHWERVSGHTSLPAWKTLNTFYTLLSIARRPKFKPFTLCYARLITCILRILYLLMVIIFLYFAFFRQI